MRPGGKASSRDNRKKGYRTLRILVLALVLGLATGGLVALGRSSLFDLKDMAFLGNERISDSRLRALSGLAGGEKLWRISLKELSWKFSASPWVKGVSLKKEYPGGLVVRIEEAVPVALLEKGGSLYLVDREGDALEMVGGAEAQFLPLIKGDPSRDRRAFMAAVSLAGAIKDMGLSARKERVEIGWAEGGANSLAVDMDGLVAKVGEGNYELKLKRLFELEGEIAQRKINAEYVDLRFNDRVVVKALPEPEKGEKGKAGQGQKEAHEEKVLTRP